MVHSFVITSESDLDDEFAGWMAESYQIGQARPRKAAERPAERSRSGKTR